MIVTRGIGNSRNLFYQHGLTLISAWISNHMPNKVWVEITYLFPNFNGATVEVWEWISNFIPHFTMDVVTYPYWDLKLNHVSKGDPSLTAPHPFLRCYRENRKELWRPATRHSSPSCVTLKYMIFCLISNRTNLKWKIHQKNEEWSVCVGCVVDVRGLVTLAMTGNKQLYSHDRAHRLP